MPFPTLEDLPDPGIEPGSPTLTGESEEELKSLLKVKEESEKVSFKLRKLRFRKLRSWHLVPSLHGK